MSVAQKKFNGVCTKHVNYTVDEEGLVHDVVFEGGCDGNLQAVARLVEGRPAGEVVLLLQDISCGRKDTSCPAQLAQALKELHLVIPSVSEES